MSARSRRAAAFFFRGRGETWQEMRRNAEPRDYEMERQYDWDGIPGMDAWDLCHRDASSEWRGVAAL